jgi:hypothetical protein
MSGRPIVKATLLFGAAVSLACTHSKQDAVGESSATTAAQSPATKAAGEWKSLVSLDNWRGYRSQAVPAGWTVEDNAITKNGVGQDIVSRVEYTDFELAFDWMLDAGGNSGIFYRATEEYNKIYWSAPELALVDDARHPDGRNPFTSAGAAHSLYAPPRGVVHEAGQWNSTRVVVRGTHVEHWMNDQKVVEFDYGSPDFNARVAKSKFAPWKNFAKATTGLIGIQGDHGGKLAIRNIRIRTL